MVKGRLMRDFGYDEISATDVLNYVASIFARGDTKEGNEAVSVRSIDQDTRGSGDIVRGASSANLKQVRLLGRDDRQAGQDASSAIPLPQIDLPQVPLRGPNQGGVGQGEGEEGRRARDRRRATARGRPARGPGEHVLEVDVSLEELAEILGEELELPNIEPRGNKSILQSARTASPASAAWGPSQPAALQAHVQGGAEAADRSGTYDPENPVVVPIKDDCASARSRRKEEQPGRARRSST